MLLHGSLSTLFCTVRDSTTASVVVIVFHVPRSARRHSRSLSGFPPPSEADDARRETVVVQVFPFLQPFASLLAYTTPVGFAITPAL